MKRVSILGATGSIGRSALAVVDAHPDQVTVVALGAGENAALLAQQLAKYHPSVVAVATEAARTELLARLGAEFRDVAVPPVLVGDEGRLAVATHPDADILLCASSGTSSLDAALAAIDAGKTLALANKEVLVMAGALMVEAAARRGVAILPVDSEHNAIHQCLHGRGASEVLRLILTASGGPFRAWDRDALARVTPEDALRHPTWQMGRKITIDSATLMNKGLEVIEARWLFGITGDAIDVVVHPQSIVHSMVALRDGSVIAQLSVTDMQLPIQYAFSYPDRWQGALAPLDPVRMGTLEFHPPDLEKFRCLQLAYDALAEGGAWPVVLNAANEVAVEAFLAGRARFIDIPAVIERALEASTGQTSAPRSLADIRDADRWARAYAAETLRTLPSS
ncbi:MAG: 1-deoxy-D-xylulose-5-phosphate reductoisomerase [Acidobacteria bacterium]|nr:1-deoxy-D-xylulose-5-phosphate reductoisomerase [Acidobacteriota bacterium]